MPARKLGGGRILGSGKGLAPPTPPTASSVSGSIPRATSPFAASESSISIESSSMSPPTNGNIPAFGQDIGASISVGGPGKAPANASALVCPICAEEMVTLLQLNRHIDDTHQELPVEEQDEVKTWFDKQVLKAKKFQPLSLINQKLRGLEVFESNETVTPALPSPSGLPARAGHTEAAADPDELISRTHWQRSTTHDYCTDPTCGKGLGPINGSINCRNCGRLFCEEHTMYQMKLSRSAIHEPVRGYWARVCETCYVSRDGYNDHNGTVIDHTDLFAGIRRKKVERQTLEISKLEKRLTKLTRLLADPPESLSQQSNGSLLPQVIQLSSQKNPRKIIEQSVVMWEDDNQVAKCPFCQQEFGSWTFRRHHCRICGRVICADPQTGCSSEVALSVATGTRSPTAIKTGTTEKPSSTPAGVNQLSVDIRMCRDCKHTIFSSQDFMASLAYKPPDQRAYETLRQFERGIRQLLPSFHKALMALQPDKIETRGGSGAGAGAPSHAQIQEAAKIRKRLVDAFGKYGEASKRLRDLRSDSATQQRLQMAVYTYASSFLHTNMLPLKSLPHLLRSNSAISSSSSRLSTPSTSTQSTLRHASFPPTNSTPSQSTDATSQAPSEASTIVSQLEAEEKELKEKLMVLEEQKYMVEKMVTRAKERRSFEEVGMLVRNGEELEGEIGELRKKISDVEGRWEGVYGTR